MQPHPLLIQNPPHPLRSQNLRHVSYNCCVVLRITANSKQHDARVNFANVQLNYGGFNMNIRRTKKTIKALKGKFNVGIKYDGILILVGQPNIHKHGISTQVEGIEYDYFPYREIKGVKGVNLDF